MGFVSLFSMKSNNQKIQDRIIRYLHYTGVGNAFYGDVLTSYVKERIKANPQTIKNVLIKMNGNGINYECIDKNKSTYILKEIK